MLDGMRLKESCESGQAMVVEVTEGSQENPATASTSEV